MSTFYSRKQENFLNPLCSSMSKNSSKEKVDWRYNERWESSGTLTHAYWKGVAVVWGGNIFLATFRHRVSKVVNFQRVGGDIDKAGWENGRERGSIQLSSGWKKLNEVTSSESKMQAFLCPCVKTYATLISDFWLCCKHRFTYLGWRLLWFFINSRH